MQAFSQIFVHLYEKQTLSAAQSSLTRHSGVQFGGVPKNPGKHAQIGPSLLSRWELKNPHGGAVTVFILTGSDVPSRLMHSMNGSPV